MGRWIGGSTLAWVGNISIMGEGKPSAVGICNGLETNRTIERSMDCNDRLSIDNVINIATHLSLANAPAVSLLGRNVFGFK